MKRLKELLMELEFTVEQNGRRLVGAQREAALETPVSGITGDSRKVQEGFLFFCIVGANRDGHDFAAEVAKKGASVLLVSHEVSLPPVCAEKEPLLVRVSDTRYAMAFVAAAWYDHPASRLKTIGITGTKGKTTTTYLIKDILEKAGRRVGLIGTIETVIGDLHIPALNTTPESTVLQQTFSLMAAAGIEIVVMEVSSQALMLHRTQGFVFDIGMFTNLEPDHIGPNEHRDLADYIHCKSLLFRQCRLGIVNGDDAHVETILEGHTCEVERFGLGEGNDLRARDLELVRRPGELGIRFRTEGIVRLAAEVPAPGRFSVYNALCAIAAAEHFGATEEEIQRALLEARVRGRIEMIPVSDSFTLMIDYAHNAMALESLLTTLRAYEPHWLVCLFGCGGNRSRQRRFEMGEVSGRLADLTVITSDNPRFEEPLEIIADIRTGIDRTNGRYVEIPDRREAIRYVIEHGEPGDIIVLAGKGHEDYQEIRGVKHPMDERVIIQEILRSRR